MACLGESNNGAIERALHLPQGTRLGALQVLVALPPGTRVASYVTRHDRCDSHVDVP